MSIPAPNRDYAEEALQEAVVGRSNTPKHLPSAESRPTFEQIEAEAIKRAGA